MGYQARTLIGVLIQFAPERAASALLQVDKSAEGRSAVAMALRTWELPLDARLRFMESLLANAGFDATRRRIYLTALPYRWSPRTGGGDALIADLQRYKSFLEREIARETEDGTKRQMQRSLERLQAELEKQRK